MDTKEFLFRICDSSGVSGYESETAGLIKDAFTPVCDEVNIDKLGNVIALKKGKGKGKVAFFSHMDEIGLVVLDFAGNGFLHFTQIGGYDQRTLLGQEVIIHGQNGTKKVFGVIGIKPPHLNTPEDVGKSVKMSDMLIDTGYTEEQLKKLVKTGDIITINRQCIELKGDNVAGKAMDDRACVAVMYEAAKLLKDFNHDMDVYFVSTTQEEVTFRGAQTSAYAIYPDIGVALDVGFAKTPELKPTIEAGKGPAIAMGPNSHPKVVDMLKTAAKDNGIPYQVEVMTSGHSGTDATAVQIVRCGVASCVISLPLKYMHTSVETAMMKDITQTARLIAAMIMGLNGKDMEEALCL